MGTINGNILERGSRLKKLLAVSAATILTALALSSPASAEVRGNKAITVFHNIDMVEATSYTAGQEMTIEIFRNGVPIGTTTGLAQGEGTTAGLEVNHGVEGAPQPGDCWVGTTPDILPGDEIRVTGDGGTDTLVVPNVDFTTQEAILVTAGNQANYPEANVNDVVVEGVAFDQAGNPIATGALEGEVRNVEAPRYRAEPNEVVGLGAGAWRAIYSYGNFQDVQNQDNITSQDVKQQKILNGEHSMVYAPLLQETYISDQGATTGPGPGCENVAPSAAHAVSTFDDKAVNINSGTLVASGTTTADAESVSVSLDDQNQNTNAVSSNNVTLNGTTWTATFDRAQLDSLSDGTLTASGVYNVADPNNPGGTIALNGQPKSIEKDVVAPGAPTATPDPAKPYNTEQVVSLNAEPLAKVLYTTDATGELNSLYERPITLSASQTIRAIAVDPVGNKTGETVENPNGTVTPFDYTIDKTETTLSANLNSGSYNGPQTLAFTSNKAGATIYYTTNGDVPDSSDNKYTDPITVSNSQSFKAVAIDSAGNRSRELLRDITIRTASRTTLNVATTNLKLGKSRVIRGAVGPAQASGKVKMVIKKPGVDVVRTLSLTNSRYSFTYKPPVAGRYSVQMSFAQDVDNLASKSVVKSFRVIR